jgi:hypothetical protein
MIKLNLCEFTAGTVFQNCIWFTSWICQCTEFHLRESRYYSDFTNKDSDSQLGYVTSQDYTIKKWHSEDWSTDLS